MGVFSATARSPRVASLEASKQIQRDAVKRHRGPRARHERDAIGDTIIVAAPNLPPLQSNRLERRKSKLVVTPVHIPPSLSPPSSPSPKKRKASVLVDDDAFTAGAGQPTERSRSMSCGKSSDPENTKNLTPPGTPRSVTSDSMGLDGESKHNHRSRTIDASTEWRKPDVVWIGLDEDACADSMDTTTIGTTKRPPESASSTDARTASLLVCLYLGRHSEKLREYSTSSTENLGASKKRRGVGDEAIDREQQEWQGGCDSEVDGRCDDMVRQTTDGKNFTTTSMTLSSPPRLVVNTSVSVPLPTTLPQGSMIASPNTDIGIGDLSLQSPLKNLAPLHTTVLSNGELQEEKGCIRGMDHEQQHDSLSSSLRMRNDYDAYVGEGGLNEEPDDDGGGNAMDGVVFANDDGLDCGAISPVLESDENPGSDNVKGPSNNENTVENLIEIDDDDIMEENPANIISPLVPEVGEDDIMEESLRDTTYPPVIETDGDDLTEQKVHPEADSASLTEDFFPSAIRVDEQDSNKAEDAVGPILIVTTVASPVLSTDGGRDDCAEGGRPDTNPHHDSEPTTTPQPIERLQTSPPPSIPGSPSLPPPAPNPESDNEETADPPREEPAPQTPQPHESATGDDERVVVTTDDDSDEVPPPPPLKSDPPARPEPPRIISMLPPPEPEPEAQPQPFHITAMLPPPRPAPRAHLKPFRSTGMLPPSPPRTYRAIMPRPVTSGIPAAQQRLGYGHRRQRRGSAAGAAVVAAKRERISIEELLNIG